MNEINKIAKGCAKISDIMLNLIARERERERERDGSYRERVKKKVEGQKGARQQIYVNAPKSL